MIRSILPVQSKEKHTSSDLRIDICIKNEGGIVRAGDTLEGTAVLNVVAEDVSYEGGPMKISVTGREWVKVNKLGKKKKESERVFCALDFPLGDLSGKSLNIFGSAFIFPFRVHLPNSLPSSTSFANTAKDIKVKIQYKVLVTGSYASAEQEFIVASEPLPDERVPCMIQPVTKQLKSVGGKGQGPLSFAASVADTHIGRGDMLKVNISTKNDSMVDIQKIELKIVEVVCGDTKPHAHDKWNPDRRFKNDLHVESIVESDGLLEKRNSRAHADKAFMRSSAEEEDVFNQIYEELVLDKHQYVITCPASARDSYSGRLISISHYLKVKLITDALTDNPKITIPLKIGYPPEQASSEFIPARQEMLALPPSTTAPNEESDMALAAALAASASESASAPHRLALPPSTTAPSEESDLALAAALAASESASAQNRLALPLSTTAPSEESDLALAAALAASESVNTQQHLALPPSSTAQHEESDLALAAALAASEIASAPQPLALPSSTTAPFEASSRALVPISVPHTQDVAFPVVVANAVPTNSVEASMISVPPDVVTLGGDAIVLYDSDQDSDVEEPREEQGQQDHAFGSQLTLLFDEMLISVEDYEIIRSKLEDSVWSIIFEAMSPEDFGNIIAHVNRDFDQPRVAALLAPVVHGGSNFTCAYAAAAVKNASDWNRPAMVEKLLPLCSDLPQFHHLIRAELTEWEAVVCEPKFTEHLLLG